MSQALNCRNNIARVEIRFAENVQPVCVICPEGNLADALFACFNAKPCESADCDGRASGNSIETMNISPCEEIAIACSRGKYSLMGKTDVPLKEALGLLDARFDAIIRNSVCPQLASVHSFGLVTADGEGVAIMGVSTAGKTTLGIACALAGMRPLGDEFGFLDMSVGRYYHAMYPLCVREHSWKVLGIKKPQPTWASLTPYGNESDMLPLKWLEAFGGLAFSQEHSVPLGYVLCPARCDKAKGVTIESLSVADWPCEILPSLDAPIPRDRLFKSFLTLISRQHIRVGRVIYSDANLAAAAIADWAR